MLQARIVGERVPESLVAQLAAVAEVAESSPVLDVVWRLGSIPDTLPACRDRSATRLKSEDWPAVAITNLPESD